jgi:hypothetical protein
MQQVGLNVKNVMVIKRSNVKIVLVKAQNPVLIVQERVEKIVIGVSGMGRLIVLIVVDLEMTEGMNVTLVMEAENQIALTVLVEDQNNVIPVLDHQKKIAIHAMVQAK